MVEDGDGGTNGLRGGLRIHEGHKGLMRGQFPLPPILPCTPPTFGNPVVFDQRVSSIKDDLQLKVVFHKKLSSINSCLPSKGALNQKFPSPKGCVLTTVVFHQRSSSIKGNLPSKIFFYQRFYFIEGLLYFLPVYFGEGCLPLNVVFNWMFSSIKSYLPLTVVVQWRSSSIAGHLPSKGVLNQKLPSPKGRVPTTVVFHKRSSSIKGHLPSKVFFYQRFSSIEGLLYFLPVYFGEGLLLHLLVVTGDKQSQLQVWWNCKLNQQRYIWCLIGWNNFFSHNECQKSVIWFRFLPVCSRVCHTCMRQKQL